MAVLVTAIHVFFAAKTWMPGTSPCMTGLSLLQQFRKHAQPTVTRPFDMADCSLRKPAISDRCSNRTAGAMIPPREGGGSPAGAKGGGGVGVINGAVLSF